MKINYLLPLFLLLLLGACDGRFPGGEPMVVIDLAAITKATGQDERVRGKVEANNATLNAQLNELAGSLEKQLQAEKEKLGERPTEADQQRLAAMTQQAQRQLGQSQSQAVQQSQQFENNLLLALREKIQPVAAEVARGRGAKAVVLADGRLLWFDPSTDITDEVIGLLRARGTLDEPAPAAALPPAEKGATDTAP